MKYFNYVHCLFRHNAFVHLTDYGIVLPVGICYVTQGTETEALNPKEWDGMGRGGDTCTLMVDPC